MAEEVVELFERGDRVWPRELEGEHERESESLVERLGLKAYHVSEVQSAIALPCHRFHPQVLHLLDADGEPVRLYHFDMPFSGLFFTKCQPDLTQVYLNEEEIGKVMVWNEEIKAEIDAFLSQSETLKRISKEATKMHRLTPAVSFSAQSLRIRDGLEINAGAEPLIRDGEILPGTFTEGDMTEWSKLFRIKLD